jgi:signal transduction histidine kinase/DNA-binding response OmpR family regulator/ligand-binding sensor domain-containing protein
MHLIFSKSILIICAAMIWLGLTAQPKKAEPFESIATAEGLSQGMVFDILQDKEGFIWVATKNGLNRYDGYNFKVFTNDPYNAQTLSSNTIVKLFEDSKGRIWAGTEDAGLNIYDKKSGKFYRITHNPSIPSSLSGNRIRFISEMANGKFLVAAEGAGFNILSLPDDFFEKEFTPNITRLSLPGNAQVYGMGIDKNGQVWIGGMDKTVYRFQPSDNSLKPFNNGVLLNNGHFTADGSIIINSNLFLLEGDNVVPLFDTDKTPAGNMLFRPNEALWELHHRELHFYDVSKWEPGKPAKWDVQLPESTRLVYPFIFDRSGILWSGSVGFGLRKYNVAGSKFKAQMQGYSVRGIVPVSPKEMLIGDFGYGWRRLKNDSVEMNAFDKIPSVTQIDNVIFSKKGDFWLKSDNSGYYKYNAVSGSLLHHPEIEDYQGKGDKQPLLEDSKGNIWFSGLGGAFTYINEATGNIDSFSISTNAANPLMAKAICTSLYEDKQGVFWAGTQVGFVKITLPGTANTPQVKWYTNNSANRNSLNYNHVSCFLDDPAEPAKYLWICTKGGGLNRLNKQTGDFFHLTTKNGLPDDVVYGILPDDAGNIWGSTNNGIFCLLANTNKDSSHWVFRNFTKANGLQDDEFNTAAFAKLPNGHLAFGGVNGINIFDPKEILTGTYTPSVFITDILINNSPVVAGDKTGVLQNNIEATQHITLNHLQDILTLEFASLDFTAPAQNKYRYQLVGIDKEWVESGTRRTATYLHLPSGTYTFKVQGSNSQGIWSDKITQLQITVLPPWWRSWWAYGVYLLLIGLGIRAYFKFTVNRAKLRQQLHYEQLEATRIKELDTLKTRLYTNITHEFRTPLTVILGMAQQVKKEPEQHLGNGMEMIIRNGESLLKLVNEMLDLSKLESGKMALQTVEGDVVTFLRYIVESFHSLAESQQKHLHYLSDLDSLSVSYDPEKIRQIVSNLLSNAIKFTPPKGNIYISVSEAIADKSGSNAMLVIKVKDTGKGIPEEQLEQIFDRFYQADSSHTRNSEGTGIGLALTRELVKLMGGEISVKSPPTGAHKGAEFTVTLPMKRSSVAVAEQPISSNLNNGHQFAVITIENGEVHEKNISQRPLILLVEDNADVVAYTATCLPDYRLAVGKDGQEGFDIATELVPDLIITDVMMPFIDGFELCQKLKADERTSHIPIIMLTAKAGIESRIEGLEHGADAYLEKPFNKEELLIRIKKMLELRVTLQQFYLKKAGFTEVAFANEKETVAPAIDAPQNEPKKTEDAFVLKVREAIAANLSNEDFTVEQLCKLVFLSHSQLHRKLEAVTGYSPNRFIRIMRLAKAKEMLQQPNTSISTIALECGYSDAGYFSRVFKQEMGVTPNEWRGQVVG